MRDFEKQTEEFSSHKIRLSKYELWLALNSVPEKDAVGRSIKTEGVLELEKVLNDSMKGSYWVLVDTDVK